MNEIEIDIANKYLICRVCLRAGILEKYLSLFEKYKDGTISEHIMAVARIEIAPEDGFPDKICPDCMLELETAVSFRLRCEKSQTVLRTSQNQLIRPPQIEPIESKVLEIKKEEVSDCEDYTTEFAEVDVSEVTTDSFLENDRNLLSLNSSNVSIPLQCNDCDQQFKSKCKLRVHWRQVHMPKKFVCSTCKRLFKTEASFKKHTDNNPKPCEVIFKNIPVRIEGEGKNRKFHCTKCSYIADRTIHIKTHSVLHTEDKPFKCHLCPNKAYTQSGALKTHIEVYHHQIKATIPCYVCGKLSKTTAHFRKHIATHNPTRLVCDICKITLKNKKCLENHMLRHSNKKNYTCEVCASDFYTLSELICHRKKHAIKLPPALECPKCGHKVRNKYQLRKHVKNHEGDKQYCCSECGRFFETQHMLEMHRKRHLESIKCPYCPSILIRRKHLYKHIREKHKNVEIFT